MSNGLSNDLNNGLNDGLNNGLNNGLTHLSPISLSPCRYHHCKKKERIR